MEKLTIEGLKGKKIVFKISGDKNDTKDYIPKLTTAIRLNAAVSLYNNVCTKTFEDRIQLFISCSDAVGGFIEESNIKDNTSSVKIIRGNVELNYINMAYGINSNRLGGGKNITLDDVNEIIEVLKKIVSDKIMLL